MENWKHYFGLAILLADDRCSVKAELEQAKKQLVNLEVGVSVVRRKLVNLCQSEFTEELAVCQQTFTRLLEQFVQMQASVEQTALSTCLRTVQQVTHARLSELSSEERSKLHFALKQFWKRVHSVPVQLSQAVTALIATIDHSASSSLSSN